MLAVDRLGSAITSRPKAARYGEHHRPIGRPGGEFGAALAVRARIDDQRRSTGILDDVEVIAECAERMQPGRDQAQSARHHAGAPESRRCWR